MRRWLTLCALLAVGCDSKATQPTAATGAAAPNPAKSATAPPASASSAAVAPKAAKKVLRTPQDKVRHGTLMYVASVSGAYRGRLREGGSVAIVFATKTAPLAPRAPGAHAGLSAEVSPATAAPTAIRRLPLRDVLAAAADDKARRELAKELRVLADGRVEATLVLLPQRRMVTLEVGRMLERTRAHKWETQLMSRTPPTEPVALLAAYQSILAVDALCMNLRRSKVVIDEKSSSVLALDDNDAFSASGRDGAIGDTLPRLSRHLVFSKALEQRLRKLDRTKIEAALRSPELGLLVTPKQLDEVEQRRQALLRLLDRRIKRRGRDKTLALP